MSKIRIAIVEDQKLFREGLVSIIHLQEDFELQLIAENADQLFTHLNQTISPPHIVLLDMSLPDINGIEINDILHKNFPEIRTIILTAYDKTRYIVKLIEDGANSFLSKNCDAEELILAIRHVFNMGFYFNKTILDALKGNAVQKKLTTPHINGIPIELTTRELEILILICKEYSTEEIAAKLFLSTRTVDGHRINILSKTGCKNVAGLVIFAISNDLFIPL